MAAIGPVKSDTNFGGGVQSCKKFLALLVARDEYSFSSDNFSIILSQNESKM